MDSRERLLRDFEAVTAEIADLDRRLTEARARQEKMRRALRAALKSGSAGVAEQNGQGEHQAATMEAVEAIRRLGEPADATKLADLLKITPSVARTRLQRAAGIGLLRRVKRGQYEPVTD